MPFYLTRFSYTPETWARLIDNHSIIVAKRDTCLAQSAQSRWARELSPIALRMVKECAEVIRVANIEKQ